MRGALGGIATAFALVCLACDGEHGADAGHDPACESKEIACDGVCVAALYDRKNCGGCGVVCSGAKGCFGGQCGSPAPMLTPRAGHQVALGSDGRLYVFGGYSLLVSEFWKYFVRRVDAYDPATNSWQTVKGLPPERTGAVAVGLYDTAANSDIIYLIGGWREVPKCDALKDVQAYKPSDNSWQSAPSTNLSRGDVAAVVVGSRIYAFWGGAYSQKHDLQESVEMFERADAGYIWTVVHPGPSPARWAARAVARDGLIYLLGGSTYSAYCGWDLVWRGRADVNAFDPSTATWLDPPPALQVARTQGVAALGADGKIYYAGGADEHGRPLAEVEALDSEGKSWGFVAPMPDRRSRTAGVAALDGRIYVIGGNNYGNPNGVVDTVLAYDPKEDRWYW